MQRHTLGLQRIVSCFQVLDKSSGVPQIKTVALMPGWRIVLVEFRREDPDVPIKLVHKMSVEQVKKEMSVQPLEFAETIEVLPRQHIIVFRKPGAKGADGKSCCPMPVSRAALLGRKRND